MIELFSAIRSRRQTQRTVNPDKETIDFGVLGKFSFGHFEVALGRLRSFDLFDEDEYLDLNPDVHVMDRSTHFMMYGAAEGRRVTRLSNVARKIGSVALEIMAAGPNPQVDIIDESRLPSVGIYYNSHGNVFMKDIADDLATTLSVVFGDISVLDENSSLDIRPKICFYVAPHEFFVLGAGNNWAKEDVFRSAVALNTEQPQTPWFWRGLPYCLLSKGVLDLSAVTSAFFQKVMPSFQFVPACAPINPKVSSAVHANPIFRSRAHLITNFTETTEPLPFEQRQLDLAFFGASTLARVEFFTKNAEFFSQFENTFYIRPDSAAPLQNDMSEVARVIGANSKIVLNIHRDEFGYLEWHRMVRQGMSVGAVVVSDTCLPDPTFVAGEHFLQETSRHVPHLIKWLLQSEDGMSEALRIRKNSLELLTSQITPKKQSEKLLAFIQGLDI